MSRAVAAIWRDLRGPGRRFVEEIATAWGSSLAARWLGRDASGHLHAYRYRIMPRVPDYLLKSVVYLYPGKKQAQEGVAAGGTAFVVAVFDGRSDLGIGYLITCRHVTTRLRSWWVRVNSRDPNAPPIVTRVRYGEWTRSLTDDLAIVRFSQPIHTHQTDVLPFPLAMALRHVEVGPDKYGIGDDIYIVGRFLRHGREKVNIPTVRFGHISAMPGDPVSYGGNHYRQSGFLVEASVIEGYSGSPAWVYRTGPTAESELLPGQIVPAVGRQATFGEHTRLLGVFCAVFPNAGMGLVVPAWKVVDLLNTPALVVARRQERKEVQGTTRPRRGAVRKESASTGPLPSTPDSSGPPPSPGSDESPSPPS